jgi:YhcG PDDEXK nuclease domain
MNRLHTRAGAAPSNFTTQLPAADSELAQQLTRDPYVLDFLDLTGPVAERDLEGALVDRLHDFLLELRPLLRLVPLVGTQVGTPSFEIDGDESQSTYCSSTGRSPARRGGAQDSAGSSRSTPASSASTSAGWTPTSAAPTATPQPSGCLCVRGAQRQRRTQRPGRAQPRRSPSRTTPLRLAARGGPRAGPRR